MAAPLAVPFHPQETDAACVLACAQMALGYLGVTQSQTELAHILGADPEFGTPGPRLTRLNSSELEVIYAEGEMDAVGNWLAQGLPVLLFVQTEQLDYWQSWRSQHAVMVVALDESSATLLDPAFPASENPKQVARLELQIASDWMSNRYAVIRRR